MATQDKNGDFSEFEKKAMKERAKELKAEAKAAEKREVGEKAVLEAIKTMQEPDRSMAQKIHEIVTNAAPELWPKTWYGMPAYAKPNGGKVICFFQAASKFEARYSSFGFNDAATLDEGNMWPASFAIVKLTKEEEKKIGELVKKAVK